MAQLDQIRRLAEVGDWRGALKIAQGFYELGKQRDPIQKAYSAIRYPQLYLEMGQDPHELKAAGIAALKERFNL